MKYQSSDGSVFIITEEGECDFSRASYDARLSSSEYLESENVFSVTLDRVAFHNVYQVAKTLLESHGYVGNFENILAVIDQMTFAVRARTSSRDNSIAKIQFPTIATKLPEKNQVSELLSQFYKEIEAYEAQLTLLQTQKKNELGEKNESQKKLNQRVSKLEKENDQLRVKVAELSKELLFEKNQNRQASRAISSQNLLPPQMRLGKVRDIEISNRSIVIKVGQKMVSVPMLQINLIPDVDDPCIVYMDQGRIKGVFFYMSKGQVLTPEVADVLVVEGEGCKVRNSLRNTYVIDSRNEEEADLIRTLKRGDRLLIYRLKNHLIKFQKVPYVSAHTFTDKVQQDIAKHQLGEVYYQGIALNIEESEKREIDEGA